jgi:hypothetical protein
MIKSDVIFKRPARNENQKENFLTHPSRFVITNVDSQGRRVVGLHHGWDR